MSIPQQTNFLPMKIVEELTKKLDISPSMHKDAVEKYLAVAKYLGESTNFLLQDAEIYPQGSIRLKTVVRPTGKEEFDIDLVIHLPNVTKEHNANDILKLIGDRLLDEKSIYKDKVTPLKRGWRINYETAFHLDITPAIDNAFVEAEEFHYTDTAELVPDKELKLWKDSNPRGLEKWFSEIAEKMPIFVIRSVMSYDSEALITEAGLQSYTIEDIPDDNEYKGLLRRIVQLLKKHRDYYFSKRTTINADFKPISIVITTLATKSYRKIIEERIEYSCPFEMMKDVVKNMHNFIKIEDEYKIVNPTNENENFAEKWNKDTKYVDAFAIWQRAAYDELVELQQQIGLPQIASIIEKSYGKDSADLTIRALAETVNKDRKDNILAPGIISSTAATSNVKANHFFGKQNV